jgi:hypothetical protein
MQSVSLLHVPSVVVVQQPLWVEMLELQWPIVHVERVVQIVQLGTQQLPWQVVPPVQPLIGQGVQLLLQTPKSSSQNCAVGQGEGDGQAVSAWRTTPMGASC